MADKIARLAFVVLLAAYIAAICYGNRTLTADTAALRERNEQAAAQRHREHVEVIKRSIRHMEEISRLYSRVAILEYRLQADHQPGCEHYAGEALGQ